MTICKICKSEITENIKICTICDFPIKGTEKEQAVFIAKQINQKSDVLESLERLKQSRMILFILGGFNILVSFTPLMKNISTADYIFNIVVGIILLGFGFLTFKKPKIALLIPLLIFILYYILLFVINPMYLFSGILWKIVIIIGLGYGYFSVRKSDKILKQNRYLASVLGFEKIGNK